MRRCLPSHLFAVCLSVLVVCAAGPPAAAQDVVRASLEDYSRDIPLGRFMREAGEQGRKDWPNPPERGGTRVQVIVNLEGAWVEVIAPHAYGRGRLEDVARRLTRQVRLPASGISSYEGRRTVAVELELPIVRRSRSRADADVPVGRIGAALLRMDLPRPVVFGMHCTDDSAATLGSGASARALRGDATFIGAGELRPGDVLHYEAVVRWPAALLGMGFLLLPLPAAVAPWYYALRRRRDEAPNDPAEVQRRYDRRPAQWLQLVLMMAGLFGGMILVALNIPEGLRALKLLWPAAARDGLFVTLAAVPVSCAACWLVMRKRRPAADGPAPRPEGVIFPPENPGVTFGRSLFLLFLPLFAMLALLTALLPVFPRWITAHPQWRDAVRVVLKGGIFIPWAGLALGAWLAWRANTRRLTSGPWYDMVEKMAARAGVKVRKVVVLRVKAPNAFANAFGTIGLTQGLIQRLEPDEVRAIVAHEIAHVARRHPRKTVLVTLAVCAPALAAMHFGEHWMARVFGDGPAVLIPFALLLAPIFVMAVYVDRGQRKREREADAMAVAWTGDPELVIRALTKLHHLSNTPGRLKRGDEALSSHPSLENRIAAIRSGPSAGPARNSVSGGGN